MPMDVPLSKKRFFSLQMRAAGFLSCERFGQTIEVFTGLLDYLRDATRFRQEQTQYLLLAEQAGDASGRITRTLLTLRMRLLFRSTKERSPLMSISSSVAS